MARGRRGSPSSSRAAPRRAAPARRAPAAPASRPMSTQSNTPAPMQPQQSGGMLSGIGSTIAQGMAFGTGSAIAHRAVGALAGSLSGSDPQVQEAVQSMPVEQQDQLAQTTGGSCMQDKELFFDCLKSTQGDQQACSFLYDQLQTCQRGEAQFH